MPNIGSKSSAKTRQLPELTRREILWTGSLFVVVSLILAAVFWLGLPCSDDTLTHFYRVVQIDRNLKDGVAMCWRGNS